VQIFNPVHSIDEGSAKESHSILSGSDNAVVYPVQKMEVTQGSDL